MTVSGARSGVRRSAHRATRQWPVKRIWRAACSAPLFVRILAGTAALVTTCLVVNGTYQVFRKPSELLFPVSGSLYKTPTETWARYGPLFEQFSTNVMTADLLAAIAQVEGSGNPVAHTHWRWSWRPAPFDLYRPASSAVGMYQMTDGTFAEAKRSCVLAHACWLNGLTARIWPADSVQLTSAYLDHAVASIVERQRLDTVTLHQKQRLAALIHLCGAGAGDAFAERGFKLKRAQKCGDHDAQRYLERVTAMQALFRGLRGASKPL